MIAEGIHLLVCADPLLLVLASFFSESHPFFVLLTATRPSPTLSYSFNKQTLAQTLVAS